MLKFKNIYNLFNKKEKINFILLLLLMIANGFLEVISIGMLIPLVTIIIEPSFNSFNFDLELINNFLILISKISINDILIFLLCVYFFKNIFILAYLYFQNKFVVDLRKRIVSDIYKKYLNQNYSFFLNNNTATIMRNLNEAKEFSLVTISYTSLFFEIINFLSLAAFLLFLDFSSSISIILIFFCILGFYFKFSRKFVFDLGKVRQIYDNFMNKIVIENISSIKEIKIFKKESYFANQLNKYNNLSANLNLKIDILLQLPRLIIEVITVAVLCFLIYRLVGDITATKIITILTVYAATAIRLMPSTTKISAYLQKINYFEPLVNLIEKELKLTSLNNEKNRSYKYEVFETLDLVDLSFSYDNTKKTIIDDLSFSIKKNKIYGIRGANGSGKSTLINIIIGFLNPTKGSVNVNGESIKNQTHSWQKQLGYVPQNIFLIEDKIINNIAFGLNENEIDHQKLKKSIELAELNEIIDNLKDGLDTLVGEKGIKLSGGQIQRIGIARALYNDPQIIILDEFSTFLDAKTEANIIETIVKLKNFKTIIITSHNKEILYKCDHIINLEKKYNV